jgi:phospholipase/lecithinase/hemolysin
MNRFNSLHLGTLVLSVAVVSTVAGPAAANFPFDELVVFGDSTTDGGNVWNLSGFTVPSDPPYFEGRFSNGPTWVDRLADRLNFAELEPSLAGGNNYAYGGAEAGKGFSPHFCARIGGARECVPNIGKQIETFLYDDNKTLDGLELIVVQGGANNKSAHNAGVQIAAHVATLADKGGKYFLVPNLEDLSVYPGFSATHTESYWDKFITDFNDTLRDELDAVELAFPDITVIPMNMTGLIDGIRINPSMYGLTNVIDPACPGCNFAGLPPGPIAANPDEFLIWDHSHFTAAAHRIIGNFAYDELLLAFPVMAQWGGVSAVPEPTTLLLIALAVSTLLALRRRADRDE